MQTLIPLITIILPAGITDASVFLDFGFTVTVPLMIPAEWISILNPVVVISIVPHYRRFVGGKLSKVSGIVLPSVLRPSEAERSISAQQPPPTNSFERVV